MDNRCNQSTGTTLVLIKVIMLKGQSTVEFSFCFVLALLLFYGCIMAIRWAGVSLVERRVGQEESLTTFVDPDTWNHSFVEGPIKQLQPKFYPGTEMNLIFQK